MNDSLSQLAVQIRTELIEVERVLGRINEGWRRAQRSADDFYLDSVALNLHGFYNGLERVFERIGVVVDGAKPIGENWHKTLLMQMAAEVTSVRPAVISSTTHDALDEYRAFRHVARRIYTFNLDAIKLENLVTGAPEQFELVRRELLAFADFLDEQASDRL